MERIDKESRTATLQMEERRENALKRAILDFQRRGYGKVERLPRGRNRLMVITFKGEGYRNFVVVRYFDTVYDKVHCKKRKRDYAEAERLANVYLAAHQPESAPVRIGLYDICRVIGDDIVVYLEEFPTD